MELNLGKAILKDDKEIKLVLLKDGKVIYESKERGIKPMYYIAMNLREEAINATVVDRVIGRGAAILASHIGIGYLYGELMSDGAKEILDKEGLGYSYLYDTPYIQNRTKTDYCPIEKLSQGLEDGGQLLERIGSFLGEKKSK